MLNGIMKLVAEWSHLRSKTFPVLLKLSPSSFLIKLKGCPPPCSLDLTSFQYFFGKSIELFQERTSEVFFYKSSFLGLIWNIFLLIETFSMMEFVLCFSIMKV